MELNNSNNSINTNSILQSGREINLSTLIENLFIGLVFLLPVFFLPFTADVFSLNKSYLVMVVASLSIIFFLVDALRKRKLQIRSMSTYLPLFLILTASLISTYFSTNRNISLFGSYGNYESSFMFVFALVIIGFVASNTKLSVSKIINSFFAGVTISVLISLVSFYLKFFPGLGQVGNSFSLIGNSNLLVGLETIVVLGAFYKLGNLTTKNVKNSLMYGFFMSICLIHLLIIGNVLSLAFIVMVVFYLFVSSKVDFAKTRNVFIPIAVMVIFITFINYFSVTRDVFNIEPFQSSLRLPLTESWLVSIQSLRDFPFTGTGIGTFLTDFTRYRPASLNIGNAWEARFSFPYNDIFLWLATAGLSGLALYVLFWVFIIRDSFKIVRVGKDKYLVAFLVIISFISLMFFGNNIPIYALVFILIGVVMNNKESSFITTSSMGSIGFISIVSLALTGFFAYHSYNIYSAQINFLKSLSVNNVSDRYQLQFSAMKADRTEGVYIRSFIDTSLFIARAISQTEKPTETDTAQIQDLVSQSIEYSRLLTEVINPLDVSNWEVRGQVYDVLSGVTDNADQFAESAYTNAINLESTNPRLWLKLGSVYFRQKSYPNSIQSFLRAVQLKNDYANAHYNLAIALVSAEDPINALTQLEIVKRLIPAGTEEAKRIDEEIKVVSKLVDEAKAKSNPQADSGLDSIVNGESSVVQEKKVDSEPLSNPNEQTTQQIDPNTDIPADILNPSE